MTKLAKVTRTSIIVIFAVALIYDIIIACLRAWDATISNQTKLLAEMFPALAVAHPLLGSHFFLSKYGEKIFWRISRIRFYIWIPIASVCLILSTINLFVAISFVVWASEHLLVPYLIGQVLGLMWYQYPKNTLNFSELYPNIGSF